MRKFLLPAIAASLVAPCSSVAAAEKVTKVVSFADLDLRTDAGLDALEDRIAAAVIVVCGAPADLSTWSTKAVKECRAAAAEDAKAQLEQHLATLDPVTVAAAD